MTAPQYIFHPSRKPSYLKSASKTFCSACGRRTKIFTKPKAGLRLIGLILFASVLSIAKGKPAATVPSESVLTGTANTAGEPVQNPSLPQKGSSGAPGSDEQPIYMLIGSGLLVFSFLTRQLSRRRKVRSAHSPMEELHAINSKAP